MPVSAADPLSQAVRRFEARDRARAAAIIIELAKEDAPLGDRWSQVAQLAATLGEVSAARAAMRRYVAGDPYDIERRLAYGAMLAQLGHVAGAVKATEAFLPNAPRADARLHHLLGACLAQLGRVEEAERHLRTAIAGTEWPELAGAAWLALADIKTFDRSDPDVTAMEALAGQWGPETPSSLLYALGKAYNDQGDVDRAFESWTRGAEKVRRQRPYSDAASKRFVDEVVAGFTREDLAKLPPSAVDSERPIFVLGLPRSGTTLVEQILASHADVVDGAELNLFRTATMELGGYAPSDVTRMAFRPDGAEVWTRFGEAYLHLLDERFGTTGRIVDKTLNHTRFVGLIHHILPKARFVWLRRDPGDVALSCFRSHFASGLDWTWSLEDIGRHMIEEDRLHAHWSALYPEAILTVAYEDLVSDPKTWISRILEHCRLPFQDNLRDFHLTERAVTTSSANQVRQPISTRAIGQWKRYEAHLASFFEAYGKAKPAL
jgi:tetratricopeptide (TPR) repeat protein